MELNKSTIKLIGVNKVEEIRVDLLWLLNWTRSESVATQFRFTHFYTANNMLTCFSNVFLDFRC